MTATGAICRGCGLLLPAGEALRVTPADGGPPFHVHRPSIDVRCLQGAGRAGQATIALADPEAAREFDRRQGGAPANRGPIPHPNPNRCTALHDPAGRRRTALHEAGHAVADYVLGRPIEYVSIRPGLTFGGIAVTMPRDRPDAGGFAPWSPVALQPPALRADIERQIIATLAGELSALFLAVAPGTVRYSDDAAEEIAGGALAALGPRTAELVVDHEESEESSGSDETNAWDLAVAFAGPEVGGHYLGWLRAEARELVICYHGAISRVADALERHAVLAGEQVAALVHPPKGA